MLEESRRESVVDDCVALVDSEVASKSGLSGAAVKGAYALVKKIKPSIITEAVERLLDPFVAKLDPYYVEFTRGDETDLVNYMQQRSDGIASSLLEVTDARIDGAQNRTIQKAYHKLRPSGEKHVQAAVPGIARVIAKHANA